MTGLVIGSSQKPLSDNTQHSQQTDIHTSGGIRTRNPSKRTTADHALDCSATGIGDTTSTTTTTTTTSITNMTTTTTTTTNISQAILFLYLKKLADLTKLRRSQNDMSRGCNTHKYFVVLYS